LNILDLVFKPYKASFSTDKLFKVRGLKYSPLEKLFIKLELVVADVTGGTEFSLAYANDLTATGPFLEL